MIELVRSKLVWQSSLHPRVGKSSWFITTFGLSFSFTTSL